LWLFGRNRSARLGRATVVSLGRDGVGVFEEHNGLAVNPGGLTDPHAPDGEHRLARLAQETGQRHPIILRLPADRVFARTLTLPDAALADAARIADLDLEHETPFRRADVATAVVVPANGLVTGAGQVDVRQLVVKRSAIADGERLLSRYGLAADRIDAWQPTLPGGAPTAYDVDFRASGATAPKSAGNGLIWSLAGSAVALAVIAAAVVVVRLDATLADAQAVTAAARADLFAAQAADAGRAANLAIVRDVVAAEAAEVDRVRILATLSRLVPEADHLISLKVSGNSLEATGYAGSATALVLAMERSDLFATVSLTSAVTYDDRLNRERYTFRAEIDRKALSASSGGDR